LQLSDIGKEAAQPVATHQPFVQEFDLGIATQSQHAARLGTSSAAQAAEANTTNFGLRH
jgi:hypothetical protein